MRYLSQLLTDIAEIRLQRCGQLAAKNMLHQREHMLGYRCDFAGAAGEHANDIFEEARMQALEELSQHPESTDEHQHIKDVEAFLRGPDEAMPTMAQRIGLDLEALPPPDVLSDDQLSALNEELIPTLALHGVTYGGPKDYPPRLKFEVVLTLALRRSGIIDNGGFVDDGCTGSPVGCTWGAYCSCLQYSRKEEFIAEGGDPSYPDDRFYQGDGDPFGFTPPTEEEKEKAAKFDALPLEEKMRIWEEEDKHAPPCEMHGEDCGKW